MKATAIGFVLAGLAALVASFFTVQATLPRLDEARASSHWPTTEGVVVDLWLTRRSGTHVTYRYEVEGREYESTQVRLVEKFFREKRSDRAARYPEGTRVTVWYDPLRPERAVLEPGTSRGATAKAFVAAGIFCILSLGLVAVGVHGLRS